MAQNMDMLTPEQRSERMAMVRSQDTKPEMAVRRLIFAMGYRYRLHDRRLPGNPDLVFRGRRKAIFIHGCFWHRHEGCRRNRIPKSRLDYWVPKLEGNRERDAANQAALRDIGWDFLIVWECETGKVESLAGRIRDFLDAAA